MELYAYIYSNPMLTAKCNGIYSSNDLPIIFKPGFYIINTDPDYLPGSHWLALFVTYNNHAYYFDSLGKVPIDSVAVVLHNSKLSYDYSTRRIQSNGSDVCGDYCLLFVYFMCKGNDLSYFLSLFGDDLTNNDVLVEL